MEQARLNLVREVRRRIASGYYRDPAVWEHVLDGLMADLALTGYPESDADAHEPEPDEG